MIFFFSEMVQDWQPWRCDCPRAGAGLGLCTKSLLKCLVFNLVSPPPCPSCPLNLTWSVPSAPWNQLWAALCSSIAPEIMTLLVPGRGFMAGNIPQLLEGYLGAEEPFWDWGVLLFPSLLCSVSAGPWRWQGHSWPSRIYWQERIIFS